MLPKLRKSLQKPEKRISPPVLAQKAPHAIEAPKAVIKALYDYTQGSAQELSFQKGDFFHVVGNENDQNWYDACNPSTSARGLVPVQFFQVLGKSQKDSGDLSRAESHDSSSAVEGGGQTRNQKQSQPTKASPLYGIVQFDFQAERPDELDAKAGEAIIIIAQSNHEWFVAKPIGRLGGPGLIPVSFIEIRDMATGKPIGNLEEIAAKAAVPKVEEWKKAAAEYKNSSIPLGRFDFDRQDEPASTQSDRQVDRQTSRSGYGAGTYQEHQADPLYVARASVDQFLLENSRYWFLVRVEMNDGRHRNLCRYYEDFYDFQIALLEEFPVEAGRTGEQRILPFMPGPLAYVDDTISAQRRADLSVYVEELCTLPAHVVRSKLVQDLFSAREGDVESSHPTSMMPQPIQTSKMRSASISQTSSRRSDVPKERTQSTQYVQPENRSRSNSVTTKQQSRNSTGYAGAAAAQREPQAAQFIKIKVFYDDDLIAIRVAQDIEYDQLCEKLRDRLSGAWTTISTKDESGGSQHIGDDRSFRDLLNRTDKVVLYVR